ncbi:MAG: FxDxF family PEP-CTERM protein [Sphingomonadaceae bacterium]
MKRQLLAATFCAMVSSLSFAADQSVTVTTTPVLDTDNHFIGVTNGADGILSGNLDVITFTGLAAGTYKFDVSVSGQNLVFDPLLSNLNGVTGVVVNAGIASFEYIGTVGPAPFTLTLAGIAGDKALYSGDVTVSAVPEPSTYAMLGSGLALLGLARRRKSPQRFDQV